MADMRQIDVRYANVISMAIYRVRICLFIYHLLCKPPENDAHIYVTCLNVEP